MKFLKVSLSAFLLFVAAYPAFGADDAPCAAENMQLFYQYLNPQMESRMKKFPSACSPSGKFAMPSWLQESLPAMVERKVWKDPEEGDLSEAVVWQTTISILYEFADEMKKNRLVDEKKYADIRLRFIISLDRLKRARLGSSFGGRGAGMLSSLNKITEKMDRLTGRDAGEAEYAENSGEIFKLTRQFFAALFSEPSSEKPYDYLPAERLVPGYRGVTIAMPGHQLLFLSPGDRIDVLSTFEAFMGKGVTDMVTATILQNIIVLNVAKPEEAVETGAIQVLCNPLESEYLVLALSQGKALNITRRPEGDLEMTPMNIASFGTMFR